MKSQTITELQRQMDRAIRNANHYHDNDDFENVDDTHWDQGECLECGENPPYCRCW